MDSPEAWAKPICPLEVHLYCPYCDKRLGKRHDIYALMAKLEWELVPPGERLGPEGALVELERRYTNKVNDRHPIGSWWRDKISPGVEFRGQPRGRTIHKALKEKERSPMPTKDRPLHAQRIYRLLDQLGPEELLRRFTSDRFPRPRGTVLPPGMHVVICYKCKGRVSIEGWPKVDVSAVAR